MILNVRGKDNSVNFRPGTLIIAGFTGKDTGSAREHLKELEEMGISVPEKIPAFYPVDPSRVTTSGNIAVSSKESSGEAEPVLITTGGKMFIAVGSDHTARDMEKVSIHESKKACSKPISSEVFELDYFLKNWDSMVLKSFVMKDGKMEPYQDGKVSSLLTVHELMEKLWEWNREAKLEESAIFMGTVPLLPGKFVYGDWYRVELVESRSGVTLSCEYSVKFREEIEQ